MNVFVVCGDVKKVVGCLGVEEVYGGKGESWG